jgi:hypothetical protein
MKTDHLDQSETVLNGATMATDNFVPAPGSTAADAIDQIIRS